MSEEFHYPDGKHGRLKRQLPVHWVSLKKYLSERRPFVITKEKWNALLEDGSPGTIYVSIDADNLNPIATTKQQTQISARELFLEAMRPVLQNAVNHNEHGYYVPPGEMEDCLSDCDKKFTDLRKFVSNLPAHVRYELGMQTVLELEENLQALIKSKRPRHPKLPGARGFFRDIFLNIMVNEYRQAYGEFPNHTYSRKGDPQEAKAKGFHGVAYEMCELTGFSPAGIEKVLAAIIGIKPPRPIEEVRAEMAARSATQSTDT